MDKEVDHEGFANRLLDLEEILSGQRQQDFDLFSSWMKQIMIPRLPKHDQPIIEMIIDKYKGGKDMQSNLARGLDKAVERYKMEGEKKQQVKMEDGS